MRKPAVVSLIVLMAVVGLRSQSSYVTHYTTENGLPSNGIKGMEWDAERQLLWLATEAGIVRFNGQFFTTFDQANAPWLSSNRISFMGKTQHGAVFGLGEKRVMFNIDGLRPVLSAHLGDQLPSPAKAYSLFRDPLSAGRADTANWKGLIGYYRQEYRVMGYPGEQLFLGRDSILFRFCPGMIAPERYDTLPPGAQVFAIGEQLYSMDGKGRFWHYRPADRQLRKVPAPFVDAICRRGGVGPQSCRVIWKYGQQIPVLISGHTAWALRRVDGEFRATLISDAVPAGSNFTLAHYWEEGRQLFLATDAKGFYQLRQPLVRQWTETRYGDPARSKASYSQVLLPSGNILTQNGQVFGPYAQPSFPDWFGRGNIGRNVRTHPNGSDLFIPCQDTLYQCSARADSCRPLFHLPRLHAAVFFPLAEGLLIADKGRVGRPGGILRYRKGNFEDWYRFARYNEEEPPFFDLFPWGDHQVALATCSGLWLLDTLTRQLDTLPGTEALCIRTSWRHEDYVFLGTYGDGIWVYRDGRLRSLPLDPQQYLLYAHCFQPDRFGYVWISSNRGLFRVHLNDLLDAADGLDQQVFYRYFGLKEGMSLTEMNGGCNPCALELPDGRLSFPTMDGLLWVDPAKMTGCFPQPEPYIEAVQAGGQRFGGEAAIRFPGPVREVDLQLEYSYFSNSENNYLYYRLLPDRPDWRLVDARSPHHLRLTDLPPGTHRLQLKKLNGYDQFAQRDMLLHIPYPWYMNWYAFLLYATGLGLTIWMVYKLSTVQYERRQRELEALVAEKTWEVQEKNTELEENIRQLRRQQTILNRANQLKNRLVSILNHDIITPLRFLHLTGRNLVQNKARMPGELQDELLAEIAHTAEELQQLSTNVLNWIRYQDLGRPELAFRETNLHALAEQVRKLLAAPARSKNTRIVNTIPPDAVVRIPVEPFQIILHNLVSNSLKFTREGEIELGVQFGKGRWKLFVRDTGRGMSEAQVDHILHSDFVQSTAGPDQARGHGLGFLIIRELVELMGGTLQVESQPGRGTVVFIELPFVPGSSKPDEPTPWSAKPSRKG